MLPRRENPFVVHFSPLVGEATTGITLPGDYYWFGGKVFVRCEENWS
jgi:hypothetical protein